MPQTLSKILDLNERRMMYYGLIYPFLSYGITVWGQSAKTLSGRIFILQKWAVRYTAGLKHLVSCRDSFRHLKILTVYSLCIQETILYVKENCNCMVNKQVHITQEITKTIKHITRNNKDYHKYVHNLELYNIKPSVASCIFYNKLPNTIKQTENKNQFTRELKLFIKGCYYSIEDCPNEEFSNIGY
jgi:hypothetical protein